VDLSNGDIKAGDLLAISESQPGKAVRATKEGWVVGRALQDYKQGDTTVMMFVNLQYYTGKDFSVDKISKSIDSLTATQQQISDVLEVEKGTDVNKISMYGDLNIFGDATVNELTSLSKINTGMLTLNGEDNSINVVGGEKLKIQNNLSAGDVDFFNGKLVMTSEGSLIAKGDIDAKKVVAEEFAVKGATTLNKDNTDLSTKKDSTVGEGMIKAGTTEISIQNLHVTPGVKIFVTANTDTDGQALIVKEKKEGSFKVSLKKALLNDVKFDYWVVKVE
jgi:hypothetical protein